MTSYQSDLAQQQAADSNPAGVPPASTSIAVPLGSQSSLSQPSSSSSSSSSITSSSSSRQQTDAAPSLPLDKEATRSDGVSIMDREPNLSPNDDLEQLATTPKEERGWRRVVRNFSPSWFSVTMGTGIVSILFYFMPYNARWLYWLSVVFFCLNVLLFLLAFAISALRYTLYPEIWYVMIHDPTNSLFLGTIPMGFATLVEMWTFICVPAFGHGAATVAWVLWMIDAVVAVTVTVSLSAYLSMQKHELRSLERFTAVQLLPIAATIVAAGTGAEVAAILPDKQDALGTVITCYILWGMSVPLSMTVLVMYYQRLAVHKVPPREVIVSCFLPLGPLGFGGYTIMYLGVVARDVFPETSTLSPLAGPIMHVVGLFLALIMWGFGLVWLVIALVSIFKARPIPFNMGWWGFTFPLGVFAASTIQIGLELPSRFFRVLGEAFSVAVILLWILVAIRTAEGAWTGKLFFAPCLANLKKQEQSLERQKSRRTNTAPDQD